ncbi:peptidoglycan-associated lipoprotein [Zymomonas mobilis subsp. mobilis ZM4 = ATCC 31821]|uniref:Peptidoglycan-associated lipoprotein n=2 Tax=Zymomonas mobilis subsp. mobilis TaxID=120045 RepID=Q5NR64_ZYMMO|nr:peptidoglycan-associated lipoprotein Pal [Zymomonas mobilis]AAV88790.1 peptidoglycan-associated lipoprotein [Zymomonas mobilis subsp. mobilis ZM4 = ATCC 31821]ACV75586.1 peptidoglycan-associated lipoprotein [Zymomonas mobilis subsp. mobilis NCIMB 11163]AEH62511.1 peptidoglycan-associated lipoprotein [Zymomonas mobilis subsp. mobilis ATCC 10988]AHB10373.1 peptidoglycan-associated lipoprotein [Zymomonas mobilis subsp. mobilis str. CP4 = NRRL B-14023]AHJ70679.1 Minor outer membrane protein Omp
MTKSKLTISLFAGLVALTACSDHQPKTASLPPAPTTKAPAPTSNGNADVGAVRDTVVPGSHADFLRQVGTDMVHFALNSHDLDSEAKAILDREIQWFKKYPSTRVTIEGHCDERGTREYNIALGEKRADAVRDYLAKAGVANSINVISYGKERPLAMGSDEESWAQNRRAVTVTPN